MGQIKDFLNTVRNGGDEAVAAVQRAADDWRAMLDQAAKEVESMRLTDAEREAVRFFSLIEGPGNVPVANKRAATLRGLLERLGGNHAV